MSPEGWKAECYPAGVKEVAMSSYVREFKHPTYKVINHRRYKYLRSYGTKRDAVAEATRWVREPGISAKVTERGGLFTVWVVEKKKTAKARR